MVKKLGMLMVGLLILTLVCSSSWAQVEEVEEFSWDWSGKEAPFLNLHREIIIYDALSGGKGFIDQWIKGGATVVSPTIRAMMHETIQSIADWLSLIRGRSDLMQVTKVEDFYRAKREGKLGILLGFQDTKAIELDLNLIDLYEQLGVKIIQIAYNKANFVGGGALEEDCGLTDFGRSAVKKMNEAGITISLSHTGYKTLMDTIEVSEKPIILTHANSRAICDNPRNIPDDIAIAVAEQGGVVGINGYPAFVTKEKERPTIDDMIDHIDYFVKLIGIDHVGLGIDYWSGQAGIASKEGQIRTYNRLIKSGAWTKEAYPYALNYYPQGMEMPSGIPNLTKGLLARGYSEEDIEKIWGLNFIRVFEETWKER